MTGHFNITKASGEKVPFSSTKLHQSLERAGANEATINQILLDIRSELYDGITTRKIYQKAFKLLRKAEHHLAAKYKLKQAIMELGPSGYPFEQFIGEILRSQGYSVKIGEIVKGHCVNHEVDVVAEKDDRRLMIECKYHSNPGIKSNVKIPLYIFSRFKDVEKAWRKTDGDGMTYRGWLVTNTKFTLDAIEYGNCVGLTMIGWDYPQPGNLKERIDISGLYPITTLTSLTKKEKQKILKKGAVLCKDICENHAFLDEIGLGVKRRKTIITEAEYLCR